MSEQQPFLVHSFGPDWARDLTLEHRVNGEKPEPHNAAQRRRRQQVERLVATALALGAADLRACMVHDRFRFRMDVYQHPARYALFQIFEDDFDRELYLWAHCELSGKDGIPSPVHGAVLEVLARRYLDQEARRMLSGAWTGWRAAKAAAALRSRHTR